MSSQMPITIQVLNPIHSVVLNKQGYRLVPALSFTTEFWYQGRYRKERKTRRASVVEKITGKFPTGLLGKVKAYCDEFGIPYEVEWSKYSTSPVVDKPMKVTIPFTLRDYQEIAIDKAITSQRGVIVAPTGSGKTFIMASIATNFPNYFITITVHTKTLLYQTIKELQKFFPNEKIGQIGEGIRDYDSRISVAMIQTVNSDLKSGSLQVLNWARSLGVVFVDECHHVNSLKGTYVNFLATTMAPVRFGVTATLPTSEEGKLALEGYIGPVIHEVSMDELIDRGSLAIPVLRLFKVPENPDMRKISKYQQVYQFGVVENRSRNRKVMFEVSKLVEQGLTVLVIITRLEHGENLIDMTKRMYPDLKAIYIHGATDAEEREQVRTALNSKEYDVVIASTIWKEGVDVPSLGAIVNAAGGKSEIATIQTLGRGLRVVPGKEEIIFYDFFDNSHYYLISHFGERLCLYFELGWL